MGTPKSEISREKSDIVGSREAERAASAHAPVLAPDAQLAVVALALRLLHGGNLERARVACANTTRSSSKRGPSSKQIHRRAHRCSSTHAREKKKSARSSLASSTRRRSCRSHSLCCLAAASLLASSLARVSSLHFPSDYHIFACVVRHPSHSAPLSTPPSSLHLKSFPATSASDSSTAQNASGATGNSAGAPPSSFGATLGAGASG